MKMVMKEEMERQAARGRVGKTIKVKYFEETTDQNGNLSLRFPILLTVSLSLA